MACDLQFESAIVLGAGAVGSFLGARLSRVLPTTLVGRRAHVEAIRDGGLRLTGEVDEKVSVGAVTELPELPRRALVVVSVKLRGMPAAAEALSRRACDDTTCLVIQNGLDAGRRMREGLRRSGRHELCVIRALTSCGCNLVGPGEVEYWGGGLAFPESDEAAPAVDLFRRAGLEVTRERDFERAVWAKFAVNCVANPLSAILGVRNRELVAPELAGLRCRILEEVGAAARDAGVDLGPRLAETVERALAGSGNLNSMLQDIVYGRPTEIGDLNEVVVNCAREGCRGAPVNATVSRLVRFLEGRARSGEAGGRASA